MAAPETVDVIVLGAGPAGENAAQYAVEGTDLTALLVEGELLGGECSYYACMPSKALLRPIEVAATAAHLPGVSTPELERDALLARRDDWVSHYDDSGQASWAADAGLEVVRGHGRLSGDREVTVETAGGPRVVRARHAVVLATGSEPVIPEQYSAALPWGSRDATGVVEVPDRLVIVGGGVVACEAAVWMAALGSQVTLLVRDDRLLARVEPFAADLVRRGLEAQGVDVRLGVEIASCERASPSDTGLGRVHGGPVTVGTSDGDMVADEILVAVGRRPRLGDIGLDAVGLTVDDVRAGDVPDWLWLVGDASGEAPLTHWGKYRARVLGPQIAARAAGRPEPQPPEDVPVPQVVFTDPQVGAVGLTEEEARSAYDDVVVAEVPWTGAAGAALLRDDALGGAKLVVDRGSGRVVGATFVGPEAGEQVHAATIAITGRVPVWLLRHAVPSYPTASELWLRLLEALPAELRTP
ncbi:NAD(P)/FAD-dependent oxidoreductase [Nocardioides rotundus]|uniref:dihydrolipoyl dehydrogenase family protein n=1 Tax=Nocardioides rotundus TaxID=1774216 RepID=UPI001CBB6307|nr:NAD(P)/FAD-dependent oxidoreductase [Nocardioides rotundus]UAL29705.1 NAD(P)/FAD-dependent oxidoreductase [Nocardioides rotundus]